MKRRTFVCSAAVGLAGVAGAQEPEVPASIRALRPMMDGIQPITAGERRARVEKARRLMAANKIGAIVLEGGSSLFYFTGVRWASNLPPLTLVMPARGEPVWIAPAAEDKRVRDVLSAAGDIRPWRDPDGPFALVAQALKERGGGGSVGLEENIHFSTFDALRKLSPKAEFVNARPVTAGCRMIKSPAEIALMQRANDITIEAYRAALATLCEGMTQFELRSNVTAAYRALGAPGNVMVSFGKHTAFPHGSIQPQKLQEGDFVLLDDGCSIEGYQSDVTRTVIFGKPTDRQREIWNLERRAQDAAFAAARPGATCESVDAAARKVITDFGFGPDYKVPGLPHRTGHGIGLDIHEWTYLVRGNKTPLAPGMCFSDEPMIAIYGEFGVRLEDCMYITPDGARFFTKQSPAIDQPFG
jgi:Xaa-Pro dipeptidase